MSELHGVIALGRYDFMAYGLQRFQSFVVLWFYGCFLVLNGKRSLGPLGLRLSDCNALGFCDFETLGL